MDIALLSRMVEELILINDEVGIPGMGAFVATMEPASFSDRGYTINPPYRRLKFRSGMTQDHLVADLYASSNRISRDEAESVLGRFVSELYSELKGKRDLYFPGLGRLRMTKDGQFLFIQEDGLDIYPQGMNLAPLSLRNHLSADIESLPQTQQPYSAGVVPTSVQTAEIPAGEVERPASDSDETAPEAEIPAGEVAPEAERPASDSDETASEAEIPAGEVAPETERPASDSVEHVPDSVGKQVAVPTRRKNLPTSIKILIFILIAAIVFFGGFYGLSRLTPDFIDSILYSPEELEILRW